MIKAADFGPNKVKPEVPDGKVVPHTDKKLLNRLGEEGTAPRHRLASWCRRAAPPAADASDDPNGPRKVKIIPIPTGSAAGDDGKRPAAAIGPAVGRRSRRHAGDWDAADASAARAAAVGRPRARCLRRYSAASGQGDARSRPRSRRLVAKTAPAAEPREPPPRAPVAKTPVPKKAACRRGPGCDVGIGGTSGYVAVLSSKKSRMDALKAFADIQQKYGDVLASKTPDVQEADLGDKGLWYRAVVGPPGSRDAASAVCSQLKTAGHAGCWVTAY